MTNPRDDLMALADRLRELVFRQGQIDWDALIKIEIDLRLAASRPAPFDREAVARIIKNHVSVTVSGNAYAPRDNDRDGVASAADAILSLLRPAKAWDSATSPGMTDLMVSPESLDAVGEPGENVQSDVVAQRTWFDGENVRTENLTADDIYQKPDATPEAVGEPVAWLVNNRHGVSHILSSEPDPDFWSDIKPLYIHPPKSPDTSAAVLQSHALKQALDCLSEIAAAHIPDCPAHYAGDELSWAQRHVGSLRHKAEIARDGIAAAIRQLPTPERDGES